MSENTVVQLKYKGEVDKEYDLSKPDDLAAFKQKAEKGRYYEKNEEDIAKKLKRLDEVEGKAKIADNWDLYLNSVKSKQVPISDLYAKFKEMGIELDKQDKSDIKDDLYAEEENPLIKQLQSEVNTLKSEVKNNKDTQVAGSIERTFRALGKKYNGDDGLPKFDADEVSEFVKKKNLYMDSIDDTYENAYYMMHREKIIDVERNRSEDERKKLERKRQGLAEDEPGKVGEFKFKEPLDTNKSWKAIANDVLTDMHKQGKSIFVED